MTHLDHIAGSSLDNSISTEGEDYMDRLVRIEEEDYLEHQLGDDRSIETILEVTEQDEEEIAMQFGYSMGSTKGYGFNDEVLFAPMNRYGVRKFKR